MNRTLGAFSIGLATFGLAVFCGYVLYGEESPDVISIRVACQGIDRDIQKQILRKEIFEDNSDADSPCEMTEYYDASNVVRKSIGACILRTDGTRLGRSRTQDYYNKKGGKIFSSIRGTTEIYKADYKNKISSETHESEEYFAGDQLIALKIDGQWKGKSYPRWAQVEIEQRADLLARSKKLK